MRRAEPVVPSPSLTCLHGKMPSHQAAHFSASGEAAGDVVCQGLGRKVEFVLWAEDRIAGLVL